MLRAMSTPTRRDRLLSHLETIDHASVGDLAQSLSVTPATIRRDLRILASEGLLLRTYGGAAVADRRRAREVRAVDPKRDIAAAAATLVVEGSTIAIGSGTTTLEFARRLIDRKLTVITNALDVANILTDREGIELIILGGVVRPGVHSMLGHLAEIAANELRADALFMGIGAITLTHGLMNDSVPEIQTDRALRRMARSVVVLADASKFGRFAPAYVFGLEEVDTIVTDSGIGPELVDAVEHRNVRVLVAPSLRAAPQ
jgi:DeoR/GlpR family transcriptional regulator of sugar metabolism